MVVRQQHGKPMPTQDRLGVRAKNTACEVFGLMKQLLQFSHALLEYTVMNALLLLADLAPAPRASWAPVVLMILIGVGFAVGNLVLSLIIGPHRTGPGKEQAYESGMVPIGDTRKRFNVRFYIVAMIFLVFDVDIIFFYPFCTIFPQTAANQATHGLAGVMLVEMILFIVILLVADFYAWGKGVFTWD